ncbi:MAG: YidC/Oxa1 family membrane protein insertase [Chloroflexi bacterium]|nr:YidC/Oxa1 family membrane protein insertase [Chloroflexota bacterium]
MELIGDIWDLVINRPMINSLVFLYWVCFSNFGLSIIVFTVATRLLMVPLTMRQVKMTRAMSELAPKAQEISEKYKGDSQRRSQETMKLYRESGVNPVGCLGPLVLQMPIFIGLFWALRSTLASTPESLADLATKLYPWLPGVGESIPIDPYFLGLNLGDLTSASGFGPFLALVVAGSTWLMQKMSTSKATSPQQEQTSKMLLWFMPIMIGVFSLQFETGLTIYWTVSNIVGIVVQGFIGGWGQVREAFSFGSLATLWGKPPAGQEKDESQSSTNKNDGRVSDDTTDDEGEDSESGPRSEEAASDEHRRNDGQDARRGDRVRSKGARRRARRSRNRRR